jgi:hypothetical protein
MYDIVISKDTNYYNTYAFKTKNECNQILNLELSSCDFNVFNKADTYNVKFYITTKRREGYQFLKQTGKDGIKSLVWAKKCILFFIQSVLRKDDRIVVFADDKKRMRVYEYALISAGFKATTWQGQHCLMYKHN